MRYRELTVFHEEGNIFYSIKYVAGLMISRERVAKHVYYENNYQSICKELGLVVQSIVSLRSSLRGQLVKCFTTF